VDVVCGNADERALLQSRQSLLANLAVTEALRITEPQGYVAPAMAGVHATGSIEVVVHLAGLIDLDKERERLNREQAKALKDLQGLQKRFDNAEFVAKAPPDVVVQGRADMAALQEKLDRLQGALSRLPS
jgi:valyl-tRNA synthetase